MIGNRFRHCYPYVNDILYVTDVIRDMDSAQMLLNRNYVSQLNTE